MIRRGQQKKRDLRRAKKVADEQISQTRGTYQPPPREDCAERRYERPIGDEGLLQLLVMFWRHTGSTVDFVLIIQKRTWEAWENTARIDCAHGTCHVHYSDDAPASKHLLTLNSATDVKTAMAIALKEIDKIADMIMQGEEGSDD